MEKRKWLWKKKPSEKSPGETESSESISSHSERYSDDQEVVKASPNDNSQSPEVTSKASVSDEEVNHSVTVKSLAEKLSAALVNVSAKEDLVKQHSKVAEEAVAGWEKAENELAAIKQHLEATVQKNVALEDRVSHLDGALKECVRQLRQSKDEQEKRIHDVVSEKASEWEFTKLELESQIIELKTLTEAAKPVSSPSINPELNLKLESLERENSSLKFELSSLSEELEIRTIERDLSTQAAETASKQHLENIKKVAKLEAECRRLQAITRKSSLGNYHKALTGSSLTDSHSDSGDRLNDSEPSLSDSWASALIAELDQFKNDKTTNKNPAACSLDIDMMDDFLEMERIAALPEVESKKSRVESKNEENTLRAEMETMIDKVADLEEKLKKIEAEKAELENALTVCQDSLKESQVRLNDAEIRLQELQGELQLATESKELLEFQLVGVEVEARTMSSNVDLLKEEVKKEQSLSAEMAAKCRELEDELMRKTEEVQLQQTASSKGELKVKQEDIVAASEKLAECQKTIASLGRQLNSLATLEDFLIDTANLPGFSGEGSPIPGASGELWKLHTNDTYKPKVDSGFSKVPEKSIVSLANGNDDESPASSSSSTSSSTSLNRVSSSKSRNGFGKLFSRSKSGVQLENQQS